MTDKTTMLPLPLPNQVSARRPGSPSDPTRRPAARCLAAVRGTKWPTVSTAASSAILPRHVCLPARSSPCGLRLRAHDLESSDDGSGDRRDSPSVNAFTPLRDCRFTNFMIFLRAIGNWCGVGGLPLGISAGVAIRCLGFEPVLCHMGILTDFRTAFLPVGHGILVTPLRG